MVRPARDAVTKPADGLLDRTEAVLAGKGFDDPIEVTEKRTATSKTFDLGNGVSHVAKRLRPVHYDDAGELKEIDLTIDIDGNVAAAPYIANVLEDAIGYRYESRKGGWMQIELTTLDGLPVVFVPPLRIEKNEAWWDDIAPDVSMYFKAMSTHPEIFKVYGSAPHTTVWTITSSPDFPGVFNDRTTGKDAAGDNLEVLTTYAALAFTEEVTGRVSRIAERRRRRKAWFTDPAYPLLVDAAIQENIGAEGDDVASKAFYSPVGIEYSTYLATVDQLLLAQVTHFTGQSSHQEIGLRFQTLAIPAGATIDGATLSVNVIQRTSPSSKVYGADVDDLGVWANPGNRVLDVAKTTANTAFAPVSTGVKVIDVTTAVAEIVARGGWVTGNDLGLVMVPQGTAGTTSVGIEGLPAAGTDEAQLDITYTEGAAAAAGAPQKARARTRGSTPRSVSPLRMQFDGRRRRGR